MRPAVMLQMVKTHLSLSSCGPIILWVSTKKRKKKKEEEKEGKWRRRKKGRGDRIIRKIEG
jgi:hypothetical protein